MRVSGLRNEHPFLRFIDYDCVPPSGDTGIQEMAASLAAAYLSSSVMPSV